MSSRIPAAVRFWTKVEYTDGCWLWRGAGDAYGHFSPGGSRAQVQAHRWAYEFCVGSIPAGLVIDHLCRERRCVRPDHLEPVSERVNILRGMAPIAITHTTGICKRGHDLTAPGVAMEREGRRRCRICRRERNKEWMRAHGKPH